MAAQFVDALKGYEYFLSKRGKASLDDINLYLVQQGRNTISQRTYTHYRKLLSNGFRNYIPINKFDVFQSLGRLQMISDRRRYSREKVELSAKLSRDRQKWIRCTIIDKSLVGFGLVTNKRFPVRPGTQLWLSLQNYNDIPVIVAWRKHTENHTRLGVRAFEFITKYRVSDQDIDDKRLSGLLKVTRKEKTTIQWDELIRILEKTDQLLAAVSDLIYSISDLLETDIRLARSVLDSIKFGSPGEAQVKIDFGIADIIQVIVEKIQFYRLEKKKLRAEILREELENQNRFIEIYRNAIKLRKEIGEANFPEEIEQELEKPIARVFGLKQLPEGTFEDGSLENSILHERVLPAATELVAGDDLDFDVNASSQ